MLSYWKKVIYVVKKLTDKERQLVEENHNLIYAFLHEKQLDKTEYYGLIAESLCKAVMNWNKDRGALSTLFYRVANRDLYTHWRNQNVQKRRNEGEVKFEDLYFELNYNLENEVLMKEIIEGILNSEYAEIFNLRLQGLTQTEIADIIGVSQVEISRRLKKMGERYFDRTR